jgi:hypothetical protein
VETLDNLERKHACLGAKDAVRRTSAKATNDRAAKMYLIVEQVRYWCLRGPRVWSLEETAQIVFLLHMLAACLMS